MSHLSERSFVTISVNSANLSPAALEAAASVLSPGKRRHPNADNDGNGFRSMRSCRQSSGTSTCRAKLPWAGHRGRSGDLGWIPAQLGARLRRVRSYGVTVQARCYPA